MNNLNINKDFLNQNEKNYEDDTARKEENLSNQEKEILKRESIDLEMQSDIVEIIDQERWTTNNSVETNTQDTVIDIENIEVREDSSVPVHIPKSKRVWFNRKRRQTRQLWEQVYQAQGGYPPPGPQGYPPSGPPQYPAQWHQGYPQQGYPQQRYPPQGYPLQGYPPQGYPLGPPPPPQPVMFGQVEPYGAPLDYDPESRNSFVRLVMIIVFIMLLITAAFVLAVLITPDLRDFFRRAGLMIWIPAIILMLIANYSMMCSACARSPPCNFIMLGLAVISMSLMAALISSYYKTVIVFYAAIATAAIVLVCLGLACTNFDFTKWLLYVIVIGTGFSVIAIVVLLGMKFTGTYMKPVHLCILVISVVIQAVVLVIELQMILGGKSVEIGEDDYALAAFMLYTSIMDIFIKMVQILGILDH